MDNLFKELHTKAIGASLLISNHFYEGNSTSKRMGRILKTLINVLNHNEDKFDKMRNELGPLYEKMAKVHNQYYQKMGGKLGSGDFVAKDVDELAEENSDFLKILEGISPQGMHLLQMSIPALTNLLDSPFPDSNKFADRIIFSHWITLLSMYDDKDRDNVIRIISKYDVTLS